MSQTLCWLLTGLHAFWRGVCWTSAWLAAPIAGAKRLVLRAVEIVRGLFSAASLFVFTGAVQWALANLNMLPLDAQTALKISSILSAMLFFGHLGLQLLQQDNGKVPTCPMTPPTPPQPPQEPSP